MGRRRIPDRWLNYSPIGERIAGTSFIAFKVPLKETLIRDLPQLERFTTQVLMESVPNIGLVIDLTNTDRYYDRQDFLGQGIQYEKIFCRGHEIPSQSVVDKFFAAVDNFCQSPQSCSADHGIEKLIGVHCTHGLNRTGYLVCRYMIRRLRFSPEDAIAEFEKARGYPMEREGYLQSLKSLRFNERSDQSVNINSHSFDVLENSGNDQNPDFSSVDGTNSFPGIFQRMSINNSVDHKTDMRSAIDFTNSSRRSTARNDFSSHRDDFTRSRSDMTDYFGNSLPRMRRYSVSWPPGNGRSDDFNHFSPNARTTFRRYRRGDSDAFEPEEGVPHSNRAFSRRFHERDYDENKYSRSRRFQDLSASPYDRNPRYPFHGRRRTDLDWRRK